MENRRPSGDISSLHDIKEVSKRTVQFIKLAIAVAALIVPVRIYFGHYFSAGALALFCFFCGVVLFFHKKGGTKNIKLITIAGIDIFLTFFVIFDGLNMGGYLYFFPMFFVLPFLVNNHERYNREVAFYFIITLAAILACFLFANNTSNWQNISAEAYKIIFIVNIISSTLLSVSFAFLSIYFERKYAQALIEQKNKTQEAMNSRTQFLSHMGHELRTPLNGIIGATNLITKGQTLPEQAEYINILKYCSDHMLDLINNILDYNKIEADKMEIHYNEVNLKHLLDNVARPFENRFTEKDIEFKVVIDPQLDQRILVDDIRITQVLNNLLSNALKFTEDGYVTLNATCLSKNDSAIEVRFSVDDTGIGISEENYRKIFESFEQVYTESTRKYGGTGLGLTISQRLLKLMDSKLEVDSEVGKGTNFSFSVSFRKSMDTSATQQTLTKVEAQDLSGMRVLVAEDNLINMMIATRLLQGWNVEYSTAENGKEALNVLSKNSNYNLILLDLEMPEMDGYTAVKEITKLYPDVPVLAFTATLVDQEMFVNLKQMGFVDAMLKPFQPQELFSKIRYYAN